MFIFDWFTNILEYLGKTLFELVIISNFYIIILLNYY